MYTKDQLLLKDMVNLLKNRLEDKKAENPDINIERKEPIRQLVRSLCQADRLIAQAQHIRMIVPVLAAKETRTIDISVGSDQREDGATIVSGPIADRIKAKLESATIKHIEYGQVWVVKDYLGQSERVLDMLSAHELEVGYSGYEKRGVRHDSNLEALILDQVFSEDQLVVFSAIVEPAGFDLNNFGTTDPIDESYSLWAGYGNQEVLIEVAMSYLGFGSLPKVGQIKSYLSQKSDSDKGYYIPTGSYY